MLTYKPRAYACETTFQTQGFAMGLFISPCWYYIPNGGNTINWKLVNPTISLAKTPKQLRDTAVNATELSLLHCIRTWPKLYSFSFQSSIGSIKDCKYFQ